MSNQNDYFNLISDFLVKSLEHLRDSAEHQAMFYDDPVLDIEEALDDVKKACRKIVFNCDLIDFTSQEEVEFSYDEITSLNNFTFEVTNQIEKNFNVLNDELLQDIIEFDILEKVEVRSKGETNDELRLVCSLYNDNLGRRISYGIE